MENGISLYPGLDNTSDENLLLLAKAVPAFRASSRPCTSPRQTSMPSKRNSAFS